MQSLQCAAVPTDALTGPPRTRHAVNCRCRGGAISIGPLGASPPAPQLGLSAQLLCWQRLQCN
eukprot:8082-Heterococcus_DN1.PRE.1